MGSLFGVLALYQAFVLPGVALSTLLVGYLILRYRDKEDPQLGLKALFSYLQMITMQVVLACGAMILTSILTDLDGRDSSGWRSLVGFAVVNGGAWVLFGKFLEKTNVEEKPAARKLFEGLGMASILVIALIAVSFFSASIFGYSSDSGTEALKAAFSFSAVYAGASFMLLKRAGML
jgi:hypothetical protein